MSTYTVTELAGCRIIKGELPLSAMGLLSQGMSKKAIMDFDLARMLGACFVVGEPDAIERLRTDPGVLAAARAQITGGAYRDLSPEAREWLATGERGASSDAMFSHFTGIGAKSTMAPSDPSDFRRCRLLIEQVPEFAPRLPTMSSVSSDWAALIARWDELCSIMDTESPMWRAGQGEAHKTYALMKSILA